LINFSDSWKTAALAPPSIQSVVKTLSRKETENTAEDDRLERQPENVLKSNKNVGTIL